MVSFPVVFVHSSLSQDITRIVRSFSKSMKSNIPSAESESGPGQQADINALLSVVKDYVRQIYKTGDGSESRTETVPNLPQPQEPGGQVHCG